MLAPRRGNPVLFDQIAHSLFQKSKTLRVWSKVEVAAENDRVIDRVENFECLLIVPNGSPYPSFHLHECHES